MIHFNDHNSSGNGPYYASPLHKFKENIKTKRSEKLQKHVLLLHEFAPVHTATIIANIAFRECFRTSVKDTFARVMYSRYFFYDHK